MTKPTVAEIKNHLRIDSADEDVLLQAFIDAAYIRTEKFLRRDFATDYPLDFPAPITVAIYLQVGQLYYNRDIASESTDALSAPGVIDLLQHYRNYT